MLNVVVYTCICNLMHVLTHMYMYIHAQVIIDNWKYVVEETYLGIISIKPLVLVATLKVTSVVSTISFHVRHVYDHTSQLVALAVSHS